MANWTFTGELGAGKSLLCVSRIQTFLQNGRPVATNMDLFLPYLVPLNSTVTYTRLNDFPEPSELWALGRASESKNEKTFGLVALDELAVFLNSREWKGTTRDKVIKYLRHVRKMHWHTYFLTQSIESIDKQARDGIIEHRIACKRTDRVPIPFIGRVLQLFGLDGTLPEVHIGNVHYGKEPFSPKVATWRYYGTALHNAYDTDQVFTESSRPWDLKPYNRAYRDAEVIYNRWAKRQKTEHRLFTYPAEIEGAFCHLSNRYIVWNHLTFKEKYGHYIQRLAFFFGLVCLLLALLSPSVTIAPSQAPERMQDISADKFYSSYIKTPDGYIVTTPDGVQTATDSRLVDGVLYLKINEWYKPK